VLDIISLLHKDTFNVYYVLTLKSNPTNLGQKLFFSKLLKLLFFFKLKGKGRILSKGNGNIAEDNNNFA